MGFDGDSMRTKKNNLQHRFFINFQESPMVFYGKFLVKSLFSSPKHPPGASLSSCSLGTPEGVTSIGAPAAAVAEATRQAMAPEEPRHQPCWKKLRRQLLGEKMGR